MPYDLHLCLKLAVFFSVSPHMNFAAFVLEFGVCTLSVASGCCTTVTPSVYTTDRLLTNPTHHMPTRHLPDNTCAQTNTIRITDLHQLSVRRPIPTSLHLYPRTSDEAVRRPAGFVMKSRPRCRYTLRGKVADPLGKAKMSFELEVCIIQSLNVVGAYVLLFNPHLTGVFP